MDNLHIGSIIELAKPISNNPILQIGTQFTVTGMRGNMIDAEMTNQQGRGILVISNDELEEFFTISDEDIVTVINNANLEPSFDVCGISTGLRTIADRLRVDSDYIEDDEDDEDYYDYDECDECDCCDECDGLMCSCCDD